MATRRKGSKNSESGTAPETSEAAALPGEPTAKKRRVSQRSAKKKAFDAAVHHLFELAFAVAANEFAKRLKKPIASDYGRARHDQWMESAANREVIGILIETLNHVTKQMGGSWTEMDSARRGLALDLTRSQLRERLFLATRKRGRQKHQTGIVGRFLAKAGVPAISRMETGGSSLQEKDHARRMFFYRVMGVKARLWAIDEHESLDSDYERTLVREKLRSSDYQNFYLKISTARAIRDLMEDRVYIDRLAQVLGRAAVSERALRTLYSRMKAELIESFAI